jgi:hypothetical protein
VSYHLVCVHPFHGYEKGQIVKGEDEVQVLMLDRDHHFVRINALDPEPSAPPSAAPPSSTPTAVPPLAPST